MNMEPQESIAPNSERRLVEAILDADRRSWELLTQEISVKRVFVVTSVAAATLVSRRWPDDPTLTQIVTYVAEIVARYPADPPVAPVIIEYFIRAALHEPELLGDIDSSDIVIAAVFLGAAMRDDVLRSSEDRSAYIAEVLEEAAN